MNKSGYLKNILVKKEFKAEIILDTSSMSDKMFKSSEVLHDYLLKLSGPVLVTDIKYGVPLQIAIESKRQLFPDFLMQKLEKDKVNPFGDFYKRNRDKIKISRTDISDAFKLVLCKKLVSIFENDKNLKHEILSEALHLWKRFNKNESQLEGDKGIRKFKQAYKAFNDLISYHYKNYERKVEFLESNYSNKDYGKLKDFKHITTNLRISSFKMDLMASAYNKIFDIDYGKKNKEKRDQSDLFRYILQAAYDNDQFRKLISEDKNFKKFRADKGEDAIIEHTGLTEHANRKINKAINKNKDKFFFIISEDLLAREAIDALRKEMKANIVIMNGYGLGFLLHKLKLVSSIEEAVGANYYRDFKEKSFAALEKVRSNRSQGIEIPDKDLKKYELLGNQQKYAKKAIEFLKTGVWEENEKDLARSRR